jgi:hypothetical protein
MEIPVMFGTAALVSFLFSRSKRGILPYVWLFFLFLFTCTALVFLFVGPLNVLMWGTLWLPALLILKQLVRTPKRRVATKKMSELNPEAP